jgi:hypothetical protein
MVDQAYSGDEIAANCRPIAVHIEELNQLFDSMDPSPFHKRDLDRNAVEYIVSSAQEVLARAPLALVLYVDGPAGLPEEGRVVGEAVREYFARESEYAHRRLRRVLRRGWVSLAIGVAFLSAAVAAGAFVVNATSGPLAPILQESLLIGGWVAMWRPLETFLYDWWPIVGEQRLHDRLSHMAVRIVYSGT